MNATTTEIITTALAIARENLANRQEPEAVDLLALVEVVAEGLSPHDAWHELEAIRHRLIRSGFCYGPQGHNGEWVRPELADLTGEVDRLQAVGALRRLQRGRLNAGSIRYNEEVACRGLSPGAA